MKRIIFLLLALLSIVNMTIAQEDDNSWKKYHKGLDFKISGGYLSGLGDAKGADMLTFEGSLGKCVGDIYGGLSVGVWNGTSSNSDPLIPIMVETKSFWAKGRIIPTGLLRIGYAINTAKDIKIKKETIKMPNYFVTQIMPGIRFCLSRSIEFDLEAGVTALTAVGGSQGTSGTNAYLSVNGSFNFHKSTKSKPRKPKKPKKPTREKGVQIAMEGGAFGGSFGEQDYKGANFAMAFTYKLNHHLSVGLGGGVNITSATVENGYSYLNMKDEKTIAQDGGIIKMPYVTNIFIRGQYNLTEKRFSPFIACDAGVHMYNYEYDFEDFKEAEDFLGNPAALGFYIEPAVGLSIRTTNNSYLDLKAGYSFAPEVSGKNKIEYGENTYTAGSRAGFKTSAPFVSIGIRHTFGWGSKWFK